MKAVAIKKDLTRDKRTADFQAMGILRATLAARTSSSVIRPGSWISRSLIAKHIGSKRFLPRNTSETRSIPTGSNCRTNRPTGSKMPFQMCSPKSLLSQTAGTIHF